MSLSLLRLQSLGPKELLEDFDVLSKWIDCASWYQPLQSTNSPPPILSPVINTMWARRHQNLDHMLRTAIAFFFFFFSFNFVNDWIKKIGLLFPAVPYLSRGPFDVWGCMWASSAARAVFCYLTALQHPVGEPLCRMHLQGMVFVRAWAKATTSNPLLSLHFSLSLSLSLSLLLEPERCAYC